MRRESGLTADIKPSLTARPAAVIAVAAMAGTLLLLAAGCSTSSRGHPPRMHVASAHQADGPSPWRLVYFDDFRHGLSPSYWGKYSGQPGGDPGGRWAPSHVVVVHGLLDLPTYRDPQFRGRWVSGGLSSALAVRQVYGKYEVRVRMDPGYGVAGAVLLWPASNRWPPEVDLWETGGAHADRDQAAATVHHGAQNTFVQRQIHARFTTWHTVGVEWLPSSLSFTLDGRTFWQVRGDAVPRVPMVLDIQSQAGTCADGFNPCPTAHTPSRVDLQVAWVRIYAYHSIASGAAP